jgi:hypothetical protein
MKKILSILLLLSINSLAFEEKVQAAYAIGIFDKQGEGENIQHKRITQNDYNDICFSKIVVFGNTSNSNIEVKIGNSVGYFENSISIYNNKKIKIAEELTFKHYNISKGYFEIRVDNKLFDTKVFVK